VCVALVGARTRPARALTRDRPDPEGTRNQRPEPVPLKTGVLQYAYDYKRVVQCVITTNKELVCNEKSLTLSRNRTVVTCCSDVIDPSQFATFDDFVKEVREVYARTWKDAYGTDSEDADAYEPPMGRPAPAFEDACEPAKLNLVRLLAVLLAVVVVALRR